MKDISEIESITNGTFLYHTVNCIKDYNQLDVDIIMSLKEINNSINTDNMDIFLYNLLYQKSILSDFEFNKLLYDISNNNLKNINDLVEYHKKLIVYNKNFYKL